MPIDPRLVTSGGSQFQISVLTAEQSLPTELTFTTSAAAVAGATSIAGSLLPALNTKILYAGLVLIANPNTVDAQLIIVATTVTGNPTSIAVEPLAKPLASGSIIKTYAGIPLIGLESANMSLQNETNQAVLLSNQGWQVTDASTGSWSFDGQMMIPKQLEFTKGAYTLTDALLNKQGLYVERFLPNGIYHAGVCVVTNASDTVQGSAYITQQVTLTGSNKPVQRRLFEVVA
jgi:hypothetical protein